MPMTVIVTRDVAPRIRGFLASVSVEIAPSVYAAPRMNQSVRARVWTILQDWHRSMSDGPIVMTWQDNSEVSGQGVLTIGQPPRQLVDLDGVILAHVRDVNDNDIIR